MDRPNEPPGGNENNASDETERSQTIFDRLMDTILNRNRNRPESNQGSEPTSSQPESTPDNASTIMITVNYSFADENDPTNPNSVGSLVISLPNNAHNRDVSTIQEFVRLATQMAYSTIITNMHKKRGITLEKFNSFPLLKLSELTNTTECSICFENFEELNNSVLSTKTDEDNLTTKKRRLNTESTSEPTEPESEQPPASENEKQRLADFTGEFAHVALKLSCGHVFGKSCLCEWLKNHTSCPLCRQSCADPESEQELTPARTPFSTYTIFGGVSTGRNDQAETAPASASELETASAAPAAPAAVLVPTTTSSAPPPDTTSNPQPSSTALPLEGNLFRRHIFSRRIGQPNSTRYHQHYVPHVSILEPFHLTRVFGGGGNEPEARVPPVLPTFVASRRTSRGVDTVSGEQQSQSTSSLNEDILDYLGLRREEEGQDESNN